MLKKTLSVFLAILMAVSVIPFFKTQTSAAGRIITLDPGHGQGTGAAGAMNWGGLQEDHYNLTISEYCKAKLESYGYTVHMTRTSHSENPSYDNRVLTAVNTGSEAFISIHNNSNGSSNPHGSMIFMVNPNYNYQMYVNTVAMARCVMDRLVSDAGTVEWAAPYYTNGSSTHPDGSTAEYYAVLWRAKRWSKGVYGSSQVNAAMIVECVFQSNYSDVVNFLMNPAKLEAMGYAIADGIADYYGTPTTPSTPSVPAYVNNIDDTEGMTAKNTDSSHIQCTASVIHGNGFYMQGWSVHEDGVSAFQGSLDNGGWTDIDSNFRQDVYDANPNHPNSSDKNAFSTTLDTSTIEPGVHTYKIRGVSKGGDTYEIATYTVTVMPTDGSTYMTVHSNAFAPGGNFIVTAKGASTYAWVGLFGADETPGEVSSYYWYEMGTNEVTFDLARDGGTNDRGTPAPGNYKLVLFADTTSRVPVDEIAVTVVGEIQYAFDTEGPITVAQGQTFHISGWGASMDGMKGYAYSIDGVRASDYLTLNQRQDVIDHLTNCGFSTTINDTHAYAADISSASMTPGEHKVAVIGITNTDVEFDIGSIQVIVTAPAVIEKIEGNVTIDRDTDANTSYIKDIDLNTTVEELLGMFTKDGCVVKDKNGNAATGKLGTGCTVELIIDGFVHEKAIIIVKADLDGDAIATSKDVILAKLYRQSQTGGNVAKLASDLDGNGDVSATDVTAIAQAVAAN